MSEPKTYHVATLHDFTKVPDARLDDCLEEFATFVRLMRGVEEWGEAIREAAGMAEPPITTTTEAFDWTDDGLRRVDVRLTVERSDAPPTPSESEPAGGGVEP